MNECISPVRIVRCVAQHADLHILPCKIWHITRKSTSVVNGARWHLIRIDDFIGKCNTMIVFTEARRLMDDTRAIFIRHIGVHNYAEGSILVLGKDQLVNRGRPKEDTGRAPSP